MTASFRDVVNDATTAKLTSGLPVVIAMRSYVFEESGSGPIALSARTCRVVFDLWDEVFRIQLTQLGGSTSTIAVNVEGVMRNCTDMRNLPVAENSALRPELRYFAAVLVEVNPVSAEMLEKISRWVTRPSGTTSISPGDDLFGSFVGLFLTRVSDADRKLAFRTAPFAPVRPRP